MRSSSTGSRQLPHRVSWGTVAARPDTLASNPVEAKRTIYTVMLAVGVLTAVVAWLYGDAIGALEPWQGWFLPTVVVLMAAFLFAFRQRRIPFRRLEEALVVAAALVILMALFQISFSGSPTSGRALRALDRIGGWLPIFYGLCFLALGTVQGAVASAVTLGFFLAFALPHVPGPGGWHSQETMVLAEGYAAQVLLIVVLANFTHIAQLEAVRSTLFEQQARTDGLTGLPNRRHAEQLLDDEVERADRYDRPLSLLLFDLDEFKPVNDLLGHDVGDRVLGEIGRVLAPRLRDSDTLARWGGEEFVVISAEMGLDEAERLAERLRALLGRHDFGIGRPLTASFGVTERRYGEAAGEMVRRADTAMYAAKRFGRNRVHRAD